MFIRSLLARWRRSQDEELRLLALTAQTEHQMEVGMLVGALRCAAVKGLLGASRCEDECAMRRVLGAWQSAVGTADARPARGGAASGVATAEQDYMKGLEV